MIDRFSLLTLAHHQHSSSSDNHSLRQATLRRKSAHLWDTTIGYPSPPMSSPPSPARRPSDLTLPSTRSEPFPPTTTNPPHTSSTPAHPLHQITAPAATFGLSQPDVSAYPPSASFAAGLGSANLGSGPGPFTATPYAPPQVAHQRTLSHEARKAKTHVASACVNCKRAHLSCDVQRPCARCIASGKQETCYDVAHKKRGRPRLRDESQFGSERSMPVTNAPMTITAPLSTPTRPIAATRQRRAESFRSIQSMTSEESSTYGPPTPSFLPRPPAPFQTPLTYQPPGQFITSPQAEPEVPTALVDLDFVIIRANQSFRQIMADDHDLTRSRLHEIAAPADSESFMSIRSRLRGEREAREPSFLPPIVPSGEDPLAGIQDSDVERFTRGLSDHTYTWVQLKPGTRGPQTFPARVRLAKATTYFAVISLPSFRPMDPAPPSQTHHQASSPYTFGPPLPPSEEALREHQRQTLAPSAPSPFQYPPEMAHPQPRYVHRRAPSFSRTYLPPQLHYPPSYQPPPPQPQHFQPSQPIQSSSREPRRLPQNQSALTSPYMPTTTMPVPPPASGRDPQPSSMSVSSALAPALGPSSMPPIHESPSTAIVGPQRSSESDEDSEAKRLRSPRKRRRMGIDEVLQK